MRKPKTPFLPLLALTALAAGSASAHVSYSNRDFGAFLADGTETPVAIMGQTVSSEFGWADATDADFGDSHRTRAFRFTLSNPGTITLTVQAAEGSGFLPAFTIYSGLTHISPAKLDHDGSAVTVAYLSGLGGDPKEGALYTLGDFQIGNDPDTDLSIPASLSQLTYVGHAADGTSANFGSVPGILGDGVADGYVTGTFALADGDYSIFIGGADYSAQGEGPYASYGITPTLTVVPEPGSAILALFGLMAAGFCRRLPRQRN